MHRVKDADGMYDQAAELRSLDVVQLSARWAQSARGLADVEAHAVMREFLRRGLFSAVLSWSEEFRFDHPKEAVEWRAEPASGSSPRAFGRWLQDAPLRSPR